MPLFEIKHRWNGSVLFSLECRSFKIAFQAYIKAQIAAGAKCGPVEVSGKNLSGVSFEGSSFESSRFEGSSFEGSRFVDSRFVGVSFEGSSFESSRFVGVSFEGSSFESSRFEGSSFVDSRFVDSRFVGVSFEGSRFVDSRFVGVSFEGSSFVDSRFVDSRFEGSSFVDSRFVDSRFVGVSFVDSRFESSRFESSRFEGSSFESSFVGSSFDNQALTLGGIDFSAAREDMQAKLSIVPDEVPALRLALAEGRINGRVYEGECCCFVGTIANAKRCRYTEIEGLRPDGGSPVELFFLSIQKGDMPENSYFSKLAVQWIDEWTEKNASDLFAEGRA